MTRHPFPRLGAIPTAGGVRFAVWAPEQDAVAVRVRGGDHRLERRGDGVFEAVVDAALGDDYLFVLGDGRALPDPCSRRQPRGIRGPSQVVDIRAPARSSARLRPALADLVLYELHVGTFSAAGTFDGVVERLCELRRLGVTAVELMPVGTFPGRRNWGYDGVYTSAPHEVYGGPAGLRRLVDAAHAEGLAVILDVVYNHIGPGADAISAFAPYFTDRATTFWGDALDYTQPGVREWAIQNAELWVRDYGVDGLRLDAVHAIHDDGRPHVLTELADRVRTVDAQTLVISEIETGDLRPVELWGHDAQWADELHHVLHVLLTGEQEGYYRQYPPSVAELARQLERTPPEALVVCSQNHDQVGNRALGDRPAPDELRLRAAAVLFAPQTPLLFMGEEYGEQRPFRFFTDHDDPEIAEATREGRRREFERFAAFAGSDVPDPQAPETFAASVLDPAHGDPALRGLYAELLALRRRLPREVDVEADERRGLLRVRRGDVELLLNFAHEPQDGVPPRDVALRRRG